MGGYQMPPLAEFVYAKGFRKVATIIQNNPEGVDNRGAFVRTWKKLGGTVVADEVFDVMDMDFATQLTKIKAAKPDVIYMCAVALQASTILKQKKELGITAQMCGPWIEDPATLMPAGPNAEGAISICTYLDYNTTLPFGRNFITNYDKKYAPKGATAYWPWANAYENVYIVAELVKRVRAKGGDTHKGEQLLKALVDNPEFKSVFGSGKLRFTEEHQVLKDLSINLIQGGKAVPQKVISYKELKKG
jgi:branched-chain amino acid transport system substrate-binding protein